MTGAHSQGQGRALKQKLRTASASRDKRDLKKMFDKLSDRSTMEEPPLGVPAVIETSCCSSNTSSSEYHRPLSFFPDETDDSESSSPRPLADHSFPPYQRRRRSSRFEYREGSSLSDSDECRQRRRRIRRSRHRRSDTDSFKTLFQLARRRSLLWAMVAIGLCSISMTVLTNRSIAQQSREVEVIQLPAKLVEEMSTVPAAGLRGHLLHGIGRLPDVDSLLVLETVVDKKNEQESTSNRKVAAGNSVHERAAVREVPSQPECDGCLRPIALPTKPLTPSKYRFDNQDRNLYRQTKRATTLEHDEQQDTTSPRVIVLHDSMAALVHAKRKPRKIQLYPPDFTDNTQLYGILDSGDERVKTMELRQPLDDGVCKPMHDWQTTFHPSCNGMHEMDLAHVGGEEASMNLFGTKGYWRNAWRVDLPGIVRQHRDTVVLKTLKIEHRFEEAHFEHDRIDAVAMERLTASPHVINIFGFCGHSVMTEYADGKRLGELADKSKKVPLARLQIARDIADGLADVHGIDGDDGPASFVHLDINPANVVSIGGRLKLNDFNIGILRRTNVTTGEPCGFPAQYPNPQWRSPEEARNEQNLTEKVDVFSMGHIFFRLICGHEPWHKFEEGARPTKLEVNEKVKKGILPRIPDEVMNSTDPEVVAIRKAMLACYTADAAKRPSARSIELQLQAALDKLKADTSVNYY